MFFAGRKAHEHKRQRTGNRPRDCRAEAEGLPQQLPHDRHRKARAHTGQDPCFRRLFPVQRRKGGQARGGRIKAPGKHQDIVRIFDIQRDEQRAQRQDHREHTRQPQLLFLRDIGPEDLVDIVHAGLYGDDQIAVCRGHDDRQNARQRQTRQADRQDLDRQRRDDCVGRAVGRELLRRDQLVRHDAHEPHQRDRQSVGQRPEEQPLLGRLSVPGSKGPLPHFRACQGEDEIGDDVADDARRPDTASPAPARDSAKIADPAELDAATTIGIRIYTNRISMTN